MNKSVKRRVYVGNLSWKVRWQDLKDHMKQVGEVVRADVMEDFDGRSKIFVREDREEFTSFRSLGRFSSRGGAGSPSESFNSRPGGRESCTILVTNLEWKTTWKDLKDLFRNCGLVLRADVLTQEDGRSKGVGRVTFANEFGARKAVNMYNDYLLFGRRIGVRFEN